MSLLSVLCIILLIIMCLGHLSPLVISQGDFCTRFNSSRLNLPHHPPIFNSTRLSGPHKIRHAIYRQVGATSTFLKDLEAGLTCIHLQFSTPPHDDLQRARVAHLKGLQSVNMSYASDRALMEAIWTIASSSSSMCSDLAHLCHTERRMVDAEGTLMRAASDLRSQELSAAVASLAHTLTTLVKRVNGIANVIHTLSSVVGTLEGHLYREGLTNFSTHFLAPLRDAQNLGIREVTDLMNTTLRAFTATMIAVSGQAARMNDSTSSRAINEAAGVINVEMQRALGRLARVEQFMELVHSTDVSQALEIGARNLVADTSRRHTPMLGAQGRLEDISGRLRLTSVGRSRDAAEAIDLQIMAIESVSDNDNQYSELLVLSVPSTSNNVNADIMYHPSTMAIFTRSGEIDDNRLKNLLDLAAAYGVYTDCGGAFIPSRPCSRQA